MLLLNLIRRFMVLLLIMPSLATAAVPQVISYQGRLIESDGSPVADGDYNLTFQIVEHDPMPMGESPLWSSGVQAVTVTDGLFVYYLGSNVPLPASIFTDDTLDSYYVRVLMEGTLMAGAGIQLVPVPFAFRATEADTAAYARSGPGSGAVGWVDDGSVVRLESGGDRVGIGTSSPGEPLVVGGDLGSYPEANYIVSANPDFEGFSGYKLGYNSNNHATLEWYGDSQSLFFHTRSMGVNYNRTLVLGGGKVGIGTDGPGFKLDIMSDGTGDGIRVNNSNGLQLFRVRESSAASGELYVSDGLGDNTVLLRGVGNSYFNAGNFGIGTTNPSGKLHVVGSGNSSVVLPTDAISAAEMMDEAGLTFLDVDPAWVQLSDYPMVLKTAGISIPGPGYVLLTATINFGANLQQEDSSHAGACVYFSKSPNECEDAEYGAVTKSTNGAWCTEWNPAPSKIYGLDFFLRHTLSAQQVFYESSGGTKAYFLNGRGWCIGYCTGGITYKARVSAVYLPTWYGNTPPPALTGPGDSPSTGGFVSDDATPPPSDSYDILSRLVEERVRAETDEIRGEFERQLQTMREQLQRQLEQLER